MINPSYSLSLRRFKEMDEGEEKGKEKMGVGRWGGGDREKMRLDG